MRSALDVVVPARNEETLIGACLSSVLLDSAGIDMRVIVVANGCSDATAERARELIPLARRLGQETVVLDLPAGGKAAALNAAQAHVRGGAIVYLDADTVLLPGALRALARALTDEPRPLLVAPRPLIVRPHSRLARGYAAVWARLPAVQDEVIGGGCYAVSAPGRRRWSTFPALVADDAYVRSRFGPGERRVLADQAFVLEMPEGRELVAVARRWRAGNRELARADPARDPSAGALGNIAWASERPRLWPHLCAFALVSAATLAPPVGGRDDGTGPRWPVARRSRQPHAAYRRPSPTRPTVRVVVVTHDNAEQIDGCLASIASAVADIMVTVVDNASGDGSAERVATGHPSVRLIRNARNRGFAAAVNQATADCHEDYVLLINPDAVLDDHAIDHLLAMAMRFPHAGIWGGRSADAHGALDPSCCLAAPSLRQAIAFGTGLATSARRPYLDPDALGTWRRAHPRAVPVLTGALLLVDAPLWRRLGGLDERYFVYGEDVDLCVRARRAGASPFFTPTARYRHRGGASSTPAERTVLILRGKATLYATHLSRRRHAVARRALLAGVALRAASVYVRQRVGHDKGAPDNGRSVWIEAWERRNEWAGGWSQGPPSL